MGKRWTTWAHFGSLLELVLSIAVTLLFYQAQAATTPSTTECDVQNLTAQTTWMSSTDTTQTKSSALQNLLNIWIRNGLSNIRGIWSLLTSGGCPTTGAESSPWYQLLLDDNYHVTSVTITTAGDCSTCSYDTTLNNFRIEVALTSTKYGTTRWESEWEAGKQLCSSQVDVVEPDSTVTVTCIGQVQGNYVRITKNGGGTDVALSICDVTVTGSSNTCEYTTTPPNTEITYMGTFTSNMYLTTTSTYSTSTEPDLTLTTSFNSTLETSSYFFSRGLPIISSGEINSPSPYTVSASSTTSSLYFSELTQSLQTAKQHFLPSTSSFAKSSEIFTFISSNTAMSSISSEQSVLNYITTTSLLTDLATSLPSIISSMSSEQLILSKITSISSTSQTTTSFTSSKLSSTHLAGMETVTSQSLTTSKPTSSISIFFSSISSFSAVVETALTLPSSTPTFTSSKAATMPPVSTIIQTIETSTSLSPLEHHTSTYLFSIELTSTTPTGTILSFAETSSHTSSPLASSKAFTSSKTATMPSMLLPTIPTSTSLSPLDNPSSTYLYSVEPTLMTPTETIFSSAETSSHSYSPLASLTVTSLLTNIDLNPSFKTTDNTDSSLFIFIPSAPLSSNIDTLKHPASSSHSSGILLSTSTDIMHVTSTSSPMLYTTQSLHSSTSSLLPFAYTLEQIQYLSLSNSKPSFSSSNEAMSITSSVTSDSKLEHSQITSTSTLYNIFATPSSSFSTPLSIIQSSFRLESTISSFSPENASVEPSLVLTIASSSQSSSYLPLKYLITSSYNVHISSSNILTSLTTSFSGTPVLTNTKTSEYYTSLSLYSSLSLPFTFTISPRKSHNPSISMTTFMNLPMLSSSSSVSAFAETVPSLTHTFTASNLKISQTSSPSISSLMDFSSLSSTIVDYSISKGNTLSSWSSIDAFMTSDKPGNGITFTSPLTSYINFPTNRIKLPSIVSSMSSEQSILYQTTFISLASQITTSLTSFHLQSSTQSISMETITTQSPTTTISGSFVSNIYSSISFSPVFVETDLTLPSLTSAFTSSNTATTPPVLTIIPTIQTSTSLSSLDHRTATYLFSVKPTLTAPTKTPFSSAEPSSPSYSTLAVSTVTSLLTNIDLNPSFKTTANTDSSLFTFIPSASLSFSSSNIETLQHPASSGHSSGASNLFLLTTYNPVHSTPTPTSVPNTFGDEATFLSNLMGNKILSATSMSSVTHTLTPLHTLDFSIPSVISGIQSSVYYSSISMEASSHTTASSTLLSSSAINYSIVRSSLIHDSLITSTSLASSSITYELISSSEIILTLLSSSSLSSSILESMLTLCSTCFYSNKITLSASTDIMYSAPVSSPMPYSTLSLHSSKSSFLSFAYTSTQIPYRSPSQSKPSFPSSVETMSITSSVTSDSTFEHMSTYTLYNIVTTPSLSFSTSSSIIQPSFRLVSTMPPFSVTYASAESSLLSTIASSEQPSSYLLSKDLITSSYNVHSSSSILLTSLRSFLSRTSDLTDTEASEFDITLDSSLLLLSTTYTISPTQSHKPSISWMTSTHISMSSSSSSVLLSSSVIPIWCPCPCEQADKIASLTSTNKTTEEVAQELEAILSEQTVDASTTSSSQRKLVSATDERQSSKVVGTVGMAFFVTVFVLIVLSDVPVLIQVGKRVIRHVRHFRASNKIQRPESRRKFSNLGELPARNTEDIPDVSG